MAVRIDPQLAAFLEGGVGIHLGTRTGNLEPNGARVIAVKVDQDGRHLVALMASPAAERVLPDLRDNAQAALVFGRPIDERSCQVKGVFVDSRPPTPEELRHARTQWDAFLENLEQIGIPRASVARWLATPDIAIRVKATALFEQTPGPGAGRALA